MTSSPGWKPGWRQLDDTPPPTVKLDDWLDENVSVGVKQYQVVIEHRGWGWYVQVRDPVGYESMYSTLVGITGKEYDMSSYVSSTHRFTHSGARRWAKRKVKSLRKAQIEIDNRPEPETYML